MILDSVILGCKEMGCPWDPDAPLYETRDRLGRTVWERKIRCLHCPSIKYERYKPNSRLRKEDRIGSPKYVRPPGWYVDELKLYWGDARARRYELGMIGVTSASE